MVEERVRPGDRTEDWVPVRVKVRRKLEAFLRRRLSLLSILAGLLLWEAVTRSGLLNPVFFPTPVTIFRRLVEETISGVLEKNLWISLYRIFVGFALGAVPGLGAGLIMGYFRPLGAVLDPWVNATYPLPKVALIPLLMVLIGFGEALKFTIIAIGVFYIMLINTRAGVLAVDRILVEAARNFGASSRQLLFEVILPSTYPFVFAGIRLSLGMALILVVVAEFTAANAGLGFMVWTSGELMNMVDIYVNLVVLGLLGLLFSEAIKILQQILTPWKREFNERI